MASIIVVSGKSRGNYLPLRREPSIIGRDEDCTMQVLGDLVSRQHLEIRYNEADKSYTAVDLNSANGVLINGLHIEEPQSLKDNDSIVLGESKMLFTAEDFLDREAALNFFHRGEQGKKTLSW